MASTLPLLAHLSPPVSHWGKWANWLASLSDAEHDAFDVLKTQSEFKYRVWFTWRLVNFSLKGIENARTAARRQEQFWMAIAKMDPNEDLWLWEDEDEGYIKAFVEDHSSDWIPESSLEMSAFEWAHASQALEERPPQRPTVSPVSHLAAHTRLRFIAWLIVADVTPKDRLRLAGLEPLVRDWRLCIADSSTYSSCCGAPHCCGVSRNIWLETMLHVYSVDDLQSIPWYPEDSSLETCKCFQRQRVLPSGQFQAMQIHPGRNSAALRVLFELVVSPWPLILWVSFRGTIAKGRTDPLQTFLNILRGPEHDLFTWDARDHSELFLVLLNDTQFTLYPRDWNPYMAEIDCKTWVEIKCATRAVKPRKFFVPDDLKVRLGAASLLFSTALSVPENILAPLHITLDQFPFSIMAHVVKPDYQKHPGLDNSESEDFWANSNVQDWLSAPFQDLCHSIWYSSAHMPILERVQSMHVVLMGTLNFLPVYTHSLVLQRTGIRDVLKELLNFRASLGHRGFLESLKCYRFDLDTLFTLLKDSERTEENLSRTAHRASADIYKCMYMCISVGVGMLVLFLQDRGSYKELLACRDTDAQTLLDLFQDFLDLDSFSAVKPLICKVLLRLSCTSGLHPRCFPLAGLQKVGQQLDGGAFGDIWKGLVGGHSVSVKIMRIFQDNDIQTVLKAFGREALIWRQLCHPNVLPFFGVYFLDNRLCLVSPWMDNGNVVNFLKQDPSYKDRLSLVLDVALGLEYLHGRNVVHGDLKGINILVTPSQRACIADFGLSSIVNAMTLRLLTTSSAPVQGGTARYQAPELFQLNEEDTPKTFASDVYGFACVCYEILTGRIPFHEFTNEIKVIVEVSAGKQPSRPLSCSGTTALDILWKLLQNCWDVEAKNRPTAHEIVQRLVGPSIRATTISSKTDWDEELTCKFRRSLQTQPLLPSVNQIERMIFSDEAAEACKECFPDQQFSVPQNMEDFPQSVRRSKRQYEEGTLHSTPNEDSKAGNPTKRLKHSPGNAAL